MTYPYVFIMRIGFFIYDTLVLKKIDDKYYRIIYSGFHGNRHKDFICKAVRHFLLRYIEFGKEIKDEN